MTLKSNFSAGIVVEVTFEITSNDDPSDINFSLSCNSQYGEPGNRATWTKDDVLLDSDGSLDLVNASTSSYTNVLMVCGRTPGTYMCQVRGTDDQLLNSATFIVQGRSDATSKLGVKHIIIKKLLIN